MSVEFQPDKATLSTSSLDDPVPVVISPKNERPETHAAPPASARREIASGADLEPEILRDSLGIQAARWLRTRIVEGVVSPGERVNEVVLAHQLGLSRGPIREALQRLASEGLIELVPKRGAFVRSVGRQELADLYDVRIALEVMAARLAARRRTSEDVAALRRSLRQATDELKVDGSYDPPELDLHRVLVESAKSPELARILGVVNQQIRLCRVRSGYQPKRAREALREHARIVKAVLGRDPDAAAREMHSHLDNSLHSIYELFGLDES